MNSLRIHFLGNLSLNDRNLPLEKYSQIDGVLELLDSLSLRRLHNNIGTIRGQVHHKGDSWGANRF